MNLGDLLADLLDEAGGVETPASRQYARNGVTFAIRSGEEVIELRLTAWERGFESRGVSRSDPELVLGFDQDRAFQLPAALHLTQPVAATSKICSSSSSPRSSNEPKGRSRTPVGRWSPSEETKAAEARI